MKRNYHSPSLLITKIHTEQMVAASITTKVSDEYYDGDAGVKNSNPFGETLFDE